MEVRHLLSRVQAWEFEGRPGDFVGLTCLESMVFRHSISQYHPAMIDSRYHRDAHDLIKSNALRRRLTCGALPLSGLSFLSSLAS
jgi:hypothetical protein